MCSVDEDDNMIVKAKPINEDDVLRERSCVKCGISRAVTVARMNDPFCMDCFEVYFAHRFRATFGKAKLVRQGEKVLVGFSGGASSRVLLKLIEDGLHKDAPKKLRFVPTLIYIDERVLQEDTSGKQDDSIGDDVLHIAQETPFPIIYTRLEEIFGSFNFCYVRHGQSDQTSNDASTLHKEKISVSSDKEIISVPQSLGKENELDAIGNPLSEPVSKTINAAMINDGTSGNTVQQDNTWTGSIEHTIDMLPLGSSESLRGEIVQVFDSVKSISAKESLLCLFRRKIFQRIASREGYSKILVGDNASLLSVRLLGNVAQGGGATVPLDTAFCDDRDDVMILRPLRELPSAEIIAYCKLKNLSIINQSRQFFSDSQQSINRLTESFVNGLHANFPSTISTIFRTGDKLSIDVKNLSHKCPLCQVPIGSPPDREVFNHIGLNVADYSEFTSSLCYGCCLILKDMVLTTELLSSLTKL